MEGSDAIWRPSIIMWLVLISCSVFFFMVNILELDTYIIHPNERVLDYIHIPDLEEDMRGFLVKSPGCRIPYMDPFDKSIIKYINNKEKLACEWNRPPLVDSNTTSLFMVPSSLEAYGVDLNGSSESDIRCCYKSFWRVEPKKNEPDQSTAKYSSSCVPFNDSVSVTNEFIEVTCEKDGKMVYQDYFSFVPPKKTPIPKWTRRPLSVLVVGIDALSRLNFIRQMPKTVEFLRAIKSFEFKGFNKVGDNTFPNLIPAFTGSSVEEITDKCWNKSTYFDNCDFVWKKYKEKGFVTSFAEDCAWMGLFYYQKEGFVQQPTDYYWTFFNAVAERKIGNTHDMNVNLCTGPRFQYKTLVDYISKFVESLNTYQKPYFSFFWGNSISHDCLNRPNLADEDYYNMLNNMNTNGYLENTVLMVMSDHGIRWGDIRSTYQGMLEERLPVLFIRLPDWYKNKYPELMINMVENTRQLVTQYDVYETFSDLIDPYSMTYSNKPLNVTKKRGYSLFEKIPNNRSCDDAGISAHWCTCQTSSPAKPDDPMVEKAALFTLDYINYKLEDYSQCTNLTLDKIFSARLQRHSDTVMNGGVMIEDYTINLRTRPGGALFEVTVRNFHTKKGSQSFDIMGTISRINLYADQSRCVSDFRMKLYCFCKEFLN